MVVHLAADFEADNTHFELREKELVEWFFKRHLSTEDDESMTSSSSDESNFEIEYESPTQQRHSLNEKKLAE